MRKVVVITGASDGLGASLAILLSKDYDLALCGRSFEKMQAVVEQLQDCDCYYECFAMLDEEKRESFCQNVLQHFGHIDVLVNNAGANIKKDKVTDISSTDLRYMFELNCISPLAMIQKFYPTMKEHKWGLIVNILSSCCLFNNPSTGAYTASKKAMEGISQILLKEVKADNIGVCNVYPGGIDTNFRAIANPNYLHPETVAKMIVACIENEEGCVHEIVIRPQVEDNIC